MRRSARLSVDFAISIHFLGHLTAHLTAGLTRIPLTGRLPRSLLSSRHNTFINRTHTHTNPEA